MNTFAETIRAARRARGLTLAQIAAPMSVSAGHVSDVEHGRRAPFASMWFEMLGEMLGLDPAELHALAAHARGVVDVSGLSPRQVAKVLRIVARMRHDAAVRGAESSGSTAPQGRT